MDIQTLQAEKFVLRKAPFYAPIDAEVEIFEAAWKEKVPVLIKGPTGCGKTRFVSYMAHKLQLPLITVSCHEDLSVSDLVGRFIIQHDQTIWADGPMTAAVRMGAILYLDEVVEARKDTLVAIHPLSDHRRSLLIEKLGQLLEAPDSFLLVMSYNPGYQSMLKELKPSTRQRFVSIEFSYPSPEKEMHILEKETGISRDIAEKMVALAGKIRNLQSRGLEEGASTRLLIHACRLIQAGLPVRTALQSTLVHSLTDDTRMHQTLQDLVTDFFGQK